MTLNDIYLIAPELSLALLAILLLLLDLVIPNKRWLTTLAMLGLFVPLTLILINWTTLDSNATSQNAGLLSDTLLIDRFSLFFKLLFTGTLFAVVLMSDSYARHFNQFRVEYLVLLFFSVTGMMLLVSSMELITLYISLELTALPLAVLVAFMRTSSSSEAGIKFLVLSGISSALLVYGLVLVYGFTGSTDIDIVASRIRDLMSISTGPIGSYALLFGIVLIIAGLGFKISAVPFHMWAPDVYQGAPTPITAFLSVASKAAGFAIVLRVFYVVIPIDVFASEWSSVFALLAVLSMSIGNLVAIPQRNIKRMLAYSTVAHAGYLLVGVAAVTVQGANTDPVMGSSGVLFYLAGYAITNICVFAAVIAISDQIDSDNIDDYAGLGRRSPFLAGVLAFGMISLTGVPPTIGFMTKIYIFGAAVGTGFTWLAVVGVINSVVSAYYYIRVIKVMYISEPKINDQIVSGIPIKVVLFISTLSIVAYGIYPGPLLELARSVAEVLYRTS